MQEFASEFICARCGAVSAGSAFICHECCGPLFIQAKAPARCVERKGGRASRAIGVWRWHESLPLGSGTSLGEGGTPLIHSSQADAKGLLLKIESRNPTGSFKDRGSALVVEAAKRLGFRRLVIASTGNAAASTAAYAARAGLQLRVIVPCWCESSKLWNTAVHGGEIVAVEGGFAAANSAYRELATEGWFPAGSDNPFRTEGTKTIAYELVEQLGAWELDRVIVPIGTGGLIWSMYKGFSELYEAGVISRRPAIDGVRVESMPFPSLRQKEPPGEGNGRAVTTVATGVCISDPPLGREARAAIEATGGALRTVSDTEVLMAQRRLACTEGVSCEPTGALTMAAYDAALQRGSIDRRERTVVVVTGSLKSEAQLFEREAWSANIM